MKKYVVVFLVFFCGIFSICGQEKGNNTLLWQVSGNGLQKPSYLAGTIHIMCKNDSVIKPKVQKVIDEIDCITLESDLTNKKLVEYYLKSINELKILRSELTQKEALELSTILCEQYSYCNYDVDSWSLLELIRLSGTASLGCETTMYDIELVMKGMKGKKKIKGLDTVEEQLDVFKTTFSPSEIIRLLKSTKKGEQVLSSLVDAFLLEELDVLYRLFCENVSEDTKVVLLDNRNKVWVEKMEKSMLIEPTLFAVGSAHLGGDVSVIELLRKKGYKVTPIYN
jgi:uncharacterized protein YbaP (TraB family)